MRTKIFTIVWWLIFLCACMHRNHHRLVKKQSNCWHRLVVIVPSYNNAQWQRLNIASIARQKHPLFRVIYIDDASPDGTARLVQRYVSQHHIKNFTIIANTVRVGSLANVWHAIGECKPEEVIVTLDGDDWFAHEHVLERIDQEIIQHQAWFVYGQFQNWPTGTLGWSRSVETILSKEPNYYRKKGFHFGQPRAFYAWLAKQVNATDLIDPQTGTFYQVSGDVALTFPLVEMADQHVRFINEVLVTRNVQTPLNDFKQHAQEQLEAAYAIRRKKPYKPLLNQTVHA